MSFIARNIRPFFHFTNGKSARIWLCFLFAIIGSILISIAVPDEACAARNDVTVTISPQDAIDAGAQWRIRYRVRINNSWGPWSSFSGWFDSGYEWTHWCANNVQKLRVRINFKNAGTCSTPGNETKRLDNGEDYNTTGIYTGCSTTTSTSTTSTTSTSTTSTSITVTTTSSTTTTTLPGSECVDISDAPLDTQLQAAPATIMFVVDDSGSMDWSCMTQDGVGGRMEIGGSTYEYIWRMSDNHYTSGSYDDELSSSAKLYWESQWSGWNKMYYNPQVTYDPWPTYSDASTTAPRSNPTSATPTLTLNNDFVTIGGSSGTGVILDNGQSGYSETGSDWTSYSSGYNNNIRYTRDTGDTATWVMNLAVAGTYEVFARWDDDNDNDPNAAYTIVHGGTPQSTTIQRDQSDNPNQWVSLGSYSFNTGAASVTVERSSSGDFTVADAVKFELQGSATPDVYVKNSHYYTWNDIDEDGVVDSGENVYLVNLDGSSRSYYLFVDSDNDGYVDGGELIGVSESSVPAYVKPESAAFDLQNFANWFSYYRRRQLTAKNAMANVITSLSGVRVGIHAINHSVRQPVLEVNVTQSDGTIVDHTSTLLTQVYSIDSGGGTPLRSGLKTIGEYLEGNEGWPYGTQPYYTAAEGGECQQSFAIVMTDGNWNGSTPTDIDHQDQNMGDPYEDDYDDTLADVAMKYYKNDLSPLDDLVPENYPDMATWQHLVTYGLSFGLYGTLNPDDYDFYNSDTSQRIYATWPDPVAEGGATRIDDLWHAAVNGRGQYLSAADPEELTLSLEALMVNIESRIGSGASVSINGEELSAGSTIFQSSYSSDGWTGDVKAFGINIDSGIVNSSPDWSAKIINDDLAYTDRIIGTYNGSAGVAFRYNSLSVTQQGQLSQDQLNYIRGDESFEENQGGAFRNRTYKLGDIVHSVPVYHDGHIFVGGNDGMLHVFEESYGQEVFAYVPNLVFPNLEYLTTPAYNHKFYVDKSPYIKDTGSETLLVCGLGRGGKGYFCLDVTDPSANTEANVGNWVKWEFTDSTDLGYTFSRAFIVNSNDGWVVIFGNGYNSTSGHGVLFILNASTGSLIKKIDVGGTCNGMSTPAIIDVNNDDIVDYVYAGDLNGNMWKFDLTADDASGWEVAYKSGSTPEPLFTARGPAGSSQPITTKPDVMRHCVKNGYMVLFGTGQYLGDSDFINVDTQTIYGIWDYGDDDDDSEYIGTFNRGSTPQLSHQEETVTLLEQTEIYYGQDPDGATTYDLRVLSDNDPSWVTVDDINGTGDGADPSDDEDTPNNVGWFFDLPISKERVVRNVLVRDGKLIVVSSIPKSSPCAAGGDSILMEMDACSGSRLTEAQFDINGDGVIDENDMITIDDPDNPGETIAVAPTGITYPAMIYEPIILRDNDIEMKYFSTAAGNIIMLKEESEKRGMFYWREVR